MDQSLDMGVCRDSNPKCVSRETGDLPAEEKQEQPNRETVVAMLEAERLSKSPEALQYADVEEALSALKA